MHLSSGCFWELVGSEQKRKKMYEMNSWCECNETMCPSSIFRAAKWIGRWVVCVWKRSGCPVIVISAAVSKYHCLCYGIHQKRNNKSVCRASHLARINTIYLWRACAYSLHSSLYLAEWISVNSILLLWRRGNETPKKLLRYSIFMLDRSRMLFDAHTATETITITKQKDLSILCRIRMFEQNRLALVLSWQAIQVQKLFGWK